MLYLDVSLIQEVPTLMLTAVVKYNPVSNEYHYFIMMNLYKQQFPHVEHGGTNLMLYFLFQYHLTAIFDVDTSFGIWYLTTQQIIENRIVVRGNGCVFNVVGRLDGVERGLISELVCATAGPIE